MNALRFLPWLAVIVALVVAASGFGSRFGVWDYAMAFRILRDATYVGFGVAALALIALIIPRARAGRAMTLWASLVIALAAVALPVSLTVNSRKLPPINDITTDTANPPAFVSLVPLRKGSPVSVSYPGAATADLQHEAYPDLKPIALPLPPDRAFAKALEAARDMGWQIVAEDAGAGRIEATATTPWFGFHDDVVIRVAPDAAGSRVDIRSLSRVGKGDVGANAKRIRAFSQRLAG
jgi:uncharacterized protein (DUF1499 family)